MTTSGDRSLYLKIELDFAAMAAQAREDHWATTIHPDRVSVPPRARFFLIDAAKLTNPIHRLERLLMARREVWLNARGQVQALDNELARVIPAIINRLDAFVSDDIGKRKSGRGQYTHARKLFDLFAARVDPLIHDIPGHIAAEIERGRSHMTDQLALLSKYAPHPRS